MKLQLYAFFLVVSTASFSMYCGLGSITPQMFYTVLTNTYTRQVNTEIDYKILYASARHIAREVKKVNWNYQGGKHFITKEQQANVLDAVAFYHNVSKTKKSFSRIVLYRSPLEREFLSLWKFIAKIPLNSDSLLGEQQDEKNSLRKSYKDLSLVNLFKND